MELFAKEAAEYQVVGILQRRLTLLARRQIRILLPLPATTQKKPEPADVALVLVRTMRCSRRHRPGFHPDRPPAIHWRRFLTPGYCSPAPGPGRQWPLAGRSALHRIRARLAAPPARLRQTAHTRLASHGRRAWSCASAR